MKTDPLGFLPGASALAAETSSGRGFAVPIGDSHVVCCVAVAIGASVAAFQHGAVNAGDVLSLCSWK